MNDFATSDTTTAGTPARSGRFAGTEPQRVDRAIAALVDDNYNLVDERNNGTPPAPPALPGTWARMTDEDVRAAGVDPALLHDTKSGFDASFYRDAEGAVALVYTGTNQGRDWKHNLGQGLGLKDAQYDQAIALGREAKLAFGDNLVLSGQSLGGGLAAASSMVNGIPAVTFNSAGVHDRTIERYGVDADVAKQQAENGLIRHYVVEHDILTHLQEDAFPLNLAMPNAPGRRIDLPDPDPLSTFERMLPWKMLPHRVENHYIESVMEAMDKAGYGLGESEPARDAQTGALDTANRLLGDSVRQLAPQRDQLGLQDDQRFFNAAANVAARAGQDGLRGIDHIVPGNDRSTAFAVQGPLDDSRHQRSAVDVALASQVSTDASTAQLREQSALTIPEPAVVEAQRRTMTA